LIVIYAEFIISGVIDDNDDDYDGDDDYDDDNNDNDTEIFLDKLHLTLQSILNMDLPNRHKYNISIIIVMNIRYQ
jgi:hypothetical protein